MHCPETPDTGRPQRVAGARVIVVDGILAAYLNRSNEHLTTFLPDDTKHRNSITQSLANALANLAAPRRSMQLTKINGKPPADSPLSTALKRDNFTPNSQGYLHTGR